MNNKKIHEAIRDIVKQQGKDVMKDVRLVNILSDTVSFDDLPAAKPILRDILRSGYGARMLELGDNGEGWKLKAQAFSSELAQAHGYRLDIISYLFDCLAYGLGWVNSVKEISTSAGPAETSKSSASYNDRTESLDYKTELQKTKEQYLRTLEEGIVIPEKTSAH